MRVFQTVQTQKVSLVNPEADRLNQEEANCVQALAQRIQAQIQEAKRRPICPQIVTLVQRTSLKQAQKVLVKTKQLAMDAQKHMRNPMYRRS